MTEDDKGARLIARDFLEVTPEDAGGPFDAVCMNPPFKQGTDVKHIRHALGMLKPGGLLVSLCYDGEKQNRVLKPIADTWEILPSGSFKSSGTMASVILLTMKRKP
jgi:16S rRNA G1207 methylase RsmC